MKFGLALLACSALFAQERQPAVVNAKQEIRPFSGDLKSILQASGPAWFAYTAKVLPGSHDNCCFDGAGRHGCLLEGKTMSVSGNGGPQIPVQLEGSQTLALLFRVSANQVEKVQAYSLACPLDAGGLPFVWVTGVPASASLSFLAKLTEANSSKQVMDGAIFAIAQHDTPQADSVLERLTRPAQPDNIREQAAFWLGASRGARGVAILEDIVAHDPSEHVRDKAVFALSISKQPGALESLMRTARTDASAHIRSQALFWLAQKAGTRAAATIQNAIENDPDAGVKKRAVFALSQLPRDEGVPKLIEVARTQRDRDVRKQAFFWLGQSNDPRALAFFEEILK